MMKPIDYLLDRVTMYRLLLYYLLALLLAAIGFSLLGRLQFNALTITFSASYITLICWLTHIVFSKVFEAPSNIESTLITALILALIVSPYHNPHDILFLTAASGLAISSKYILAIRKKHIFNPAAVAVALTAIAGQTASWWVGTSTLLPFVVIGGLLIVRKIHRGDLVYSFFGSVAVSTVIINIATHHSIITSLQKTALHSSLFFLAFVMLTEPATSPTTKNRQIWYGALVGLLFPPQVHIARIYSTPELTLLAGNIFAYIVSPKLKLLPVLSEKLRIAPDIVDFIFKSQRPLAYKPGQYMEWTLPHPGVDSRGSRRYLTLASSPTEDNLRLGVRFYQNGSSYKRAMLAMDKDTPIAAGQLGGDFVLPKDPSEKLVFIAGGIGITPFRSMIKYLVDKNEKRGVILIYSDKNEQELAYRDVFNEAQHQLGLKALYTLTDLNAVPASWTGHKGYISAQMISSEVPDYMERTFYISGSHSLVTNVKDTLHSLGVPAHQIKTDFFPGYT